MLAEPKTCHHEKANGIGRIPNRPGRIGPYGRLSCNKFSHHNCVIKEGSCKIEAGAHQKPTCTLTMGAADFLDMMNGKLPAMQAYTSGKLKIGGDIMKSQLIEKLFKL